MDDVGVLSWFRACLVYYSYLHTYFVKVVSLKFELHLPGALVDFVCLALSWFDRAAAAAFA